MGSIDGLKLDEKIGRKLILLKDMEDKIDSGVLGLDFIKASFI